MRAPVNASAVFVYGSAARGIRQRPTWENDAWAITGHANVWGAMTLDAARGLLYVPTSTPSGDYYGGRRPGANLFAETLLVSGCGDRHTAVALPGGAPSPLGSTSRRRRSGDDRGRGPTARRGRASLEAGVPVVFDRVTGTTGVARRRAPVDTTTDVPGEKPWPTQPFPTRPPAFTPQGVSLDDANDLTPEVRALALEQMKKFPPRPDLHPAESPRHAHAARRIPAAPIGAARPSIRNGHAVRENLQLRLRQPGLPERREGYAHRRRISNYCTGMPTLLLSPLGAMPLHRASRMPSWWRSISTRANRLAGALGEGTAELRGHPLLKGVTLPARLGTPGEAGCHRHQGRVGIRREWRALSLCVRQGDRAGGVTRADPVRVSANPMTSDAIRSSVCRRGDRRGPGHRPGGLRASLAITRARWRRQ